MKWAAGAAHKKVVTALGVLGAVVATIATAGEARADEAAASVKTEAADASAVDTVILQNGTTLRGRVTEVSPDSHVMLRTPSGATVRIAWADLQRVLVASHLPPAYAAGAAAASSTPPIEAPVQGPTAIVHIRSPKEVFLYRRPAGSNAWTRACASPCGKPMPIGDTYKVTGNGVAASPEFRLDARPGATVEVEVDPPSNGGMVIGGMLAYGGASVAGIGLLVALAGAGESEEDWVRGGLITAAAGTVVGGLGFAMFMGAGKTDVEQRSPSRGDEARAAHGTRVAAGRVPTWRTAEATGRTGGMPAPTFPVLLSGTF